MRLSAAIDTFLGWMKWPVAMVSLVFLPGLVHALYLVLLGIYRDPTPSFAFLAGALGFLVLWRLFLRRAALGRFFLVLEHELTHALFAWATLHRVVGFRATVRSGGHVQLLGRGNWLITLAPYFFPTASLLAILALIWLPHRYLVHGNVVLGATVAYHVVSTLSETHRQQPDLQQAGWFFSALFLPSANALSLAVVLGYAAGRHPLAPLRGVAAMTATLLAAVVDRLT